MVEHTRYLTAMEALVELPLIQQGRDCAAGHRTGGYISGYRGSPLGGYDLALWRRQRDLQAADIVFNPGLNEELAATALWGTQQVTMLGGARFDGVFGIWYGKGPGVDRAGDAFKHANLAGTAPLGGVLAVVGDDHGAKSSTTAHQSDQALVAAMMPVLAPADVADILTMGLFGFALSRHSGCWVGLKLVSDIADSAATVSLPDGPVTWQLPDRGGMDVNIRWPDDKLGAEARLVDVKLPLVRAFARANGIDRLVRDDPRARLGIVTVGKAHGDTLRAISALGLTRPDAGLRVYKVGMSWPLEPEGLLAFAEGLDTLLVVEEKRAFVEDQAAAILFRAGHRIRLLGKRDDDGQALLPGHGELSPERIAEALLRVLRPGGDGEGYVDFVAARRARIAGEAAPDIRKEFFCSGCPHNTSTRVPEGSIALAGIGCHTMASRMPDRRTVTVTQMGGEGASWLGQAPFTDRKHVFQNMGDGTYTHSGFLAIRAAIAAGVNITYKLLFNDAVAMTGGQPAEAHLTIPQVVRELEAEGVTRVVVASDDPDRHDPHALGQRTSVRHRDDLDEVQKELRTVPGVSVLLYDQTCAAEKRRRRKRGTLSEPAERVFINEMVCEGCGDCGAQSSCMSVVPVETAFGRKRRIDQSNCNRDFSCLKGFCPSFVTVEGVRPRKRAAAGFTAGALPAVEPVVPDRSFGILVTGIGGTGIVTLAAIVGRAAARRGLSVSVLDVTGLAQKNGAVTSHIRISPSGGADGLTARLGVGETDLLLGCDLVVAASAEARLSYDPARTRAVVNDRAVATAATTFDPDGVFEHERMKRMIAAEIQPDGARFHDMTAIANALCGDSIAGNIILLGTALQAGLLPFDASDTEAAIRELGVAVDANLHALAIGRALAHDPGQVLSALPDAGAAPVEEADLAAIVARREAHLAGYQNRAHAARYRAMVDRVAGAENDAVPGSDRLARAVARNYAKLLAYKDEYEVARLFADPRFLASLTAQFEGRPRLRFHMAPPLLASRDPETGAPRKRRFGPWMMPALRLLARFRGLRGTPFDPFGWTAERRTERALIAEYESGLERVLDRLSPAVLENAVAWASVPERIRGYGHVKEASVVRARAESEALLAAIEGGEASRVAAE